MVGSVHRSNALHYRRRSRRRGSLKAIAAVVVVMIVLAAAVAIRATTESLPRLSVTRELAASVRFPGTTPRLAWPRQGEAAADVVGLGDLGPSGPATPAPIASLAKVMTAYVTLRDHPLAVGQPGFNYTVTAADVADYQNRLAESQSVTPVAEAEVLTESQLLQALLVASANNIAPILADVDAGSQSAFVARMNSTGVSLGMTSTTYTDPSGFSSTTVSTAADQLRLLSAAMADPVFAQIVDMPSVTLPVSGTATNFDRALGTNGFIGVKTGSDSASGGCFMFANRLSLDHQSVTVLGVVLGQDTGQSNTGALIAAAISAATALVHSVATALTVQTVITSGMTVAVVRNAEGKQVDLSASGSIPQLGWGGFLVPVRLTLSPIGRSLTAGQNVGSVGIGLGQQPDIPVTATLSMPNLSLDWRIRHAL